MNWGYSEIVNGFSSNVIKATTTAPPETISTATLTATTKSSKLKN